MKRTLRSQWITLRTLTLAGLAVTGWFAAFQRAAYDLWALNAVFAAISILLLLLLIDRWRSGKPLRFPLVGPTAAMLAAFATSAVYSWDKAASATNAWGWAFAWLSVVVLANAAEDEAQVSHFLAGLGASALVLGPLALHEQVTGRGDGFGMRLFHLLGKTWLIRYEHRDIKTTLISSILVAAFFLMWTIYFWHKTREDRRWLPLLATSALGLVLARSTWSAVCLAAGLVLYHRTDISAWARRRRAAAWTVGALVASCLAALVAFKMRTVPAGHSYAATDRFYFWLAAARMWRARPATGVGLGAFATAFPFFRAGGLDRTLFAHSFPLQILAETGLLGAGAVLWLTMAAAVRRKAGPLSSGGDREAARAAAAAALLYATINFSMEYWLFQFLLLLFAVIQLGEGGWLAVKVTRIRLSAAAAAVLLAAPMWHAPFAASRLVVAARTEELHGHDADAAKLYSDALALDANAADASAALAAQSWRRFLLTRNDADRVEARRRLGQALAAKGAARFREFARLIDAKIP